MTAPRAPLGDLMSNDAPLITIVGLGPAGPDLVTTGTLAAIAASTHRFVRTSHHPSADIVGDARSFDDIYDRADSFDEVYAEIVERLVAAATDYGHVLYAVPGSPAVAERTVEALRADSRVRVDVVPALSFLDLAWVRLGVDPLAERPRIVDAHRFADDVVGDGGPFLVTQCHSPEILSDVKLAYDLVGPREVTVLSRLGLPDESVVTIPWHELDRMRADHLTSLWIPRFVVPLGAVAVSMENTMRALRDGCPWDREQTHASLTKYMLEEAAELVEAIRALTESETAESIDHFADELGDVFFQVVFHACLAEEQGWFTLADVLRGLERKLVRRHPHVFTPAGTSADEWVADTADEVKRNWQRIKAAERANPKPFLDE